MWHLEKVRDHIVFRTEYDEESWNAPNAFRKAILLHACANHCNHFKQPMPVRPVDIPLSSISIPEAYDLVAEIVVLACEIEADECSGDPDVEEVEADFDLGGESKERWLQNHHLLKKSQ